MWPADLGVWRPAGTALQTLDLGEEEMEDPEPEEETEQPAAAATDRDSSIEQERQPGARPSAAKRSRSLCPMKAHSSYFPPQTGD